MSKEVSILTIVTPMGASTAFAQRSKFHSRGMPMCYVENTGAAFNNCGSRVVRNLNGIFGGDGGRSMDYSGGWDKPPKVLEVSEVDLHNLKAEFLSSVLTKIGDRFAWYMLPASYQTKKAQDPRTGPYTLLGFLKELGAVQVDSRPNRNHGPYNMNLWVWAPRENKTAIEKYAVVDHQKPNNTLTGSPQYKPVFITEEPTAKAAPAVAGKKPYRDANGKFAKRPK
jgi:hypothetical protein